jgi:hypothetical protein
MANAQTLGKMSPQLLKVVERAKREPEGRFNSLAHLIDVPALERAYRRMRKDAAVGVDGVTKEDYGQDLERNLRDLHERMKAKRLSFARDAISRSDVFTSRRGRARHGRLGSRRSRTNLSKTPFAKCWKPSTSRTLWTVRTASGQSGVPMTPFEPWTGSYTEAR